jgi:hypothetical protein
MAKSTLSRTWIAGLGLLAIGVVAGLVGQATRSGQSMGGLFVVAMIAIAIGALLQFIAWVLAMVATARIKAWGWFAVLLVGGILGLEFFVMLAYIIKGPDELHMPAKAVPA